DINEHVAHGFEAVRPEFKFFGRWDKLQAVAFLNGNRPARRRYLDRCPAELEVELAPVPQGTSVRHVVCSPDQQSLGRGAVACSYPEASVDPLQPVRLRFRRWG